MPTPNRGTSVSISNTPQAKDDAYLDGEDHAVSLDVMGNDLGGAAKSLYSLNQSNPLVATGSATSTLGAAISIVNGQVVYDPSGAAALQALGVGETAVDTFTYVIQLGNGTLSVATVRVTVTGANDAPHLSVDSVGNHALTEIAGVTGAQTTDGFTTQLAFSDLDLSDTHTVAIGAPAAAWSAGAVPSGTLAALNSALSHTLADSTHTGSGSVGLTFAAPDAAFDFLAQGETLTVTYQVTVSDGHGGSSAQPVSLTVTGTNDGPVLAAPAPLAVGEAASATGSQAAETASAALTFTDVDLSDVHQLSVSGPSLDWSGAGTLSPSLIAAAQQLTASLAGALTVDGLHDSTGTGAGAFVAHFSAPDTRFDFLADGETLTITYGVTVTDGHGGSSTQPVTVVVTGANDAPQMQTNPHVAAFTEGGGTGSNTPDLVNLSWQFADPDLNDTHHATVGAPTLVWSTGGAVPADVTGLLSGALSASLIDSTRTQVGLVQTHFSALDKAFDFLAQGETLKITYPVTVTDNHGASISQPVTITVTGTNDAPVMQLVDPHFPVAEHAGATGDATVYNDGATTFIFTDADLTDQHTLTVSGPSLSWAGGTVPDGLAQSLTGALTTTMTPFDGLQAHDSTGTGFGVVLASFAAADSLFDFLPAGETLSVTYNVTVDDGHGGTSTQPLTLTVTGANDAASISGLDTGSVHEDGNLAASGLLTVADADSGEAHFQAPSDAALHGTYGTFTFNDGAWTYALNNGAANVQALATGQTVHDTLTVTSDDGSASRVIDVTITGQNEPQFVQLLANNSFESGTAGWTNLTPLRPMEIVPNGYSNIYGDGHWLDTQASPGGISIAQTVDVATGEHFTLSFSVAKELLNGASPGSTLSFIWNGVVVKTITEADLAQSNILQTFSVDVVGQAGADTLAIQDNGTGSVGYALDWVKLEGWVFS